jgi:CRP/FNR family transcriptional regulator, cyclic AMP receptor protein
MLVIRRYLVEMTISLGTISKLKYFTGLEDDHLANILPFIKNKSYYKGETIVAEGDTEPLLQFVDSGVVKLFKTSSEGKEQIIEIIRPGQSFGDLALFNPAPSPYSAQALGITTDILWVHRNDLIPFMGKNWKVALNALGVLAGQARSLLFLVEDLSFKNVTGRVAKILLQHSEPGLGGLPRLTQFEMAAMAGTAREVVGRSLKSLEEGGVITMDKHKIIIKNKPYLKQLAGVD